MCFVLYAGIKTLLSKYSFDWIWYCGSCFECSWLHVYESLFNRIHPESCICQAWAAICRWANSSAEGGTSAHKEKHDQQTWWRPHPLGGYDDLASEIDAHYLICNFQHLALFPHNLSWIFGSIFSIPYISRFIQLSLTSTRTPSEQHDASLDSLSRSAPQPTISACESALIFRDASSQLLIQRPKTPKAQLTQGKELGLCLTNHVK